MKKIIITIVTSALIVVFLLGFIQDGDEIIKENTADVVYSINSIPEKLDEVGDLSKRQQDIICALSKGLVEIDINGELVPALAESVDIRNDGIEYEFIIRDDIYWSTGEKITPKDITMFFREVITTESIESLGTLTNVFGVIDYRNGNMSFDEQVAITSTEDSIIFRLNEADENFLNTLSKPQFRVRKNVMLWENIKNNYTIVPYSGNYSIIDMSENEIVLSRNKKSEQNLVKTIHIIEDLGEDLALAAFEIGDRDLVLNPSQSQLERLSSEGRLVSIASNIGMYMVYDKNNTLTLPVRRELYSLTLEALGEYHKNNKNFFELAQGSYFRDEEENLTLLQARNVMTNVYEETELPKNIYLVAEETANNKELTEFLTEWFYDNVGINLICSLIKKEDIDTLYSETYYDIALIDSHSKLKNIDEFYNKISPYIEDEIAIDKEPLEFTGEDILKLEETMFNNYLVLPLMFYNENIAKNNNIEDIVIDGNGNLKFEEIKK